jgi:hypothetical protein
VAASATQPAMTAAPALVFRPVEARAFLLALEAAGLRPAPGYLLAPEAAAPRLAEAAPRWGPARAHA